jgi:F1F0 ATPase subunit 2
MSEFSPPLLALAAGAAIGAFYFGGLWLTVRGLTRARWPAALTLGSFLGRMGFGLVGFYLVAGGRWERLLPCLLGFIGARIALTRLLGPGQRKHLKASSRKTLRHGYKP